MKTTTILTRGLLAAAALCAPLAHAQADYPNRPVRLVVTFDAGAAADFMARGIAQQLSARIGQPVVVENRLGAGGNIGADHVAKSKPDGYTLLLVSTGPLAIHQALYKKLPFNPEKDFEPITLAAFTPNILVANPSVGVKNVPELIALAKHKPGALAYSSAGVGTTQHLAGAMFNQMTGVELEHVPYKGGTFAMQDVVGGRVQLGMVTFAGLQLIRDGRLVALGVTGKSRLPALPNVPTIAQQGVKDFDAVAWFGFVAPAGTPKAIVQKLNTELVAVLGMSSLRETMALQGIELTSSTPAEMADFTQKERAKWTTVVKTANVSVE